MLVKKLFQWIYPPSLVSEGEVSVVGFGSDVFVGGCVVAVLLGVEVAVG